MSVKSNTICMRHFKIISERVSFFGAEISKVLYMTICKIEHACIPFSFGKLDYESLQKLPAIYFS